MNAWVLFLIIGTVWGGSFVAIQTVVQILPPFHCAFFRVLIAAIAIGLYALWSGRSLRMPRHLRLLNGVAALFAHGIPFLFLFWGETRVSASVGGVINGSVPLWTVVMGFWLGQPREILGKRKLAGVALGLCGLIVLYLPRLLESSLQFELAGVAAITVMAISYGAGTVLTRRVLSDKAHVDTVACVFFQLVVSTIFLAVTAPLLEPFPQMSDLSNPVAIGSLLYLGAISSGLAFVFYFTLVRVWGAVSASAVTYIVPVSTILLEFLIHRREPRGAELVGAGLILSGVALSRSRPAL